MDLGLNGKWALVCGASKGLGFGCAQALVQEGVNVVIVARNAAPLSEAQAKLQALNPQVHVRSVAADITTEEGRAMAFAAPGGPGSAFDIVVTNAGGPPPGDFRNWSREDWVSAVDARKYTVGCVVGK